jgi:ubiquinone biosynthesis protein Coq4
MHFEWLRALSPLRWLRIVIALARCIARPDTRRFYELETAMMALASSAQLERMARRFREAPEMHQAFRERFLPRTRSVEEAANFPEGTFGRAYFEFMTAHALSVDYLAPRTLESDLTWFRARQVQAHDQWHALLGIGADIAGEVEIVAVLLAQFRRALPTEPLATSFPFFLILSYWAHVLFTQPRVFMTCVRRFQVGYRRGWNTGPLWALRFEELWERPLVEVRALVHAG